MKEDIDVMQEVKKIAVVFDFDDTLCSDSTSGFLKWCGIDSQEFWHKSDALIKEGFDPVLAYMTLMVKKAGTKKYKQFFTKDSFLAYAKTIKFFPGVKRFFSKLKKDIEVNEKKVELKFYLISSGLKDIVGNSSIASQFEAVFASDFHYCHSSSRIKYAKRVVSFTDKTRFLFAISKGVPSYDCYYNPFKVNLKTPREYIAIPFKNMIYIGDGYSDIPCFALLKHYKGYGIGVYKKNKMSTAEGLKADQRVSFIADVDYSLNGELYNKIKTYIDDILHR